MFKKRLFYFNAKNLGLTVKAQCTPATGIVGNDITVCRGLFLFIIVSY